MKATGAEDGTFAGRFKRDVSVCAAFLTSDFMKTVRAFPGTYGFVNGATAWASFWNIGQLLACEELLFTSGEKKFLIAVFASELLIFKWHGKPGNQGMA